MRISDWSSDVCSSDLAELLSLAISVIRSRFHSTSKESIVPFALDVDTEDLRFAVPKQGEKRKLLDLSLKNALYFKKERLNQYEKLNPELKSERILTQMQRDLRMNVLPRHIECFDNSNFQGKSPVSAVVVFTDARPSKKDYRHRTEERRVGEECFSRCRSRWWSEH